MRAWPSHKNCSVRRGWLLGPGASCLGYIAGRTLGKYAGLAQLVEQCPCKAQVVGSSPTSGSRAVATETPRSAARHRRAQALPPARRTSCNLCTSFPLAFRSHRRRVRLPCGCRTAVSTSAFQAEDVGSIPITRSIARGICGEHFPKTGTFFTTPGPPKILCRIRATPSWACTYPLAPGRRRVIPT